MSKDIFELEGKAQADKIAKEEKRLKERELNDMRKLLKMPEFRRFLWEMLSICGLYRNPFNPNASVTSFQCGAQDIGQQLLRKINLADMYIFSQIQEEFLSEQRSREIEREKETKPE